MSLFTHKKNLADLFEGFTDFHCHILPGVDDGVQTFEDSARILSVYSELGVRKVFLTPHIMEDVPNRPDGLKARFQELKDFLEKGGVKAPELELASENMMDNLFAERLASRELLTLGGEHLLVETSYYNPPLNLQETLFQVKSAGYRPVLAHPERYIYMEDRDYADLKKKNFLFQLNLSSLSGFYGSTAQKKAEILLKKGYYDFAGTDLHRYSMLSSYRKVKLPAGLWNQLSELMKSSVGRI